MTVSLQAAPPTEFSAESDKGSGRAFVRLMPSMTDLAFLAPIAFLYGKLNGAKTMLSDADTGWHIRTGEWILAHRQVPQADIFSFTKAGEPWFAWEWLTDVLFGWLHMHGGLAAVVLACVLALALTYALLYRLVERASRNVLAAFIVTMIAMLAGSIHWLARPHLFTLLLTVVFLHILERAREGRTKALFWLPPLMTLWTNLHGGFMVGLTLIAAYSAAPVVEGLVSGDGAGRRAEFRRAAPYLAALGCSAAATLINPYSYRLHLHIFRFLNEPFHFLHIGEFQSVSFQMPGARFFEILLVLAVCAAMRNIREGRWTNVLVAAGWMHLALTSARNIPVFAIVAAPAIAETLARWLEDANATRVAGRLRSAMETGPRLHASAAAGFLALAVASFAPGAPAKLKATFDASQFPVKALDRMGDEIGRVFTHDQWGAYLIYRLYPKGRVFADDRSDFYGPAFDQAWLDALNAKYTWSAYLEQYGVDTVLLPVDAPLAAALKESRRWRLVYDDGMAIVFRPAGERMLRSQDRTNSRDFRDRG